MLFQWIEKLKELLELWKTTGKTEEQTEIPENDPQIKTRDSIGHCELKVVHGPLIQDRKSVFQGHACRVTSQDDVKQV